MPFAKRKNARKLRGKYRPPKKKPPKICRKNAEKFAYLRERTPRKMPTESPRKRRKMPEKWRENTDHAAEKLAKKAEKTPPKRKKNAKKKPPKRRKFPPPSRTNAHPPPEKPPKKPPKNARKMREKRRTRRRKTRVNAAKNAVCARENLNLQNKKARKCPRKHAPRHTAPLGLA